MLKKIFILSVCAVMISCVDNRSVEIHMALPCEKKSVYRILIDPGGVDFSSKFDTEKKAYILSMPKNGILRIDKDYRVLWHNLKVYDCKGSLIQSEYDGDANLRENGVAFRTVGSDGVETRYVVGTMDDVKREVDAWRQPVVSTSLNER